MKIQQQLGEELDRRLAAGRAADQELAVPAGVATLRLRVDSIESVGCSVRRLALETPALAGAEMPRLEEISAALTARINYLLEPLSAVECDADRATVQLRSNPPQREGRYRAYYELLVARGGTISLTRYEKRPGEARRVAPAMLTREVIGRLANDLLEAVE